MPGRDELPRTLRKSPRKAQRTWIKAHDSAVETYGEGEQAHRTAWSAVKHTFEKVGDRWERRTRPPVRPAGRQGRARGARTPERDVRGRRRATQHQARAV